MIRCPFVHSVAALACATSSAALAGLPNPVPPGGSGGWANQHLGNWRPEQPDYAFEFATITHAGNRAATREERYQPDESLNIFPNLGRVDYQYRISTTEVTANQWFPFVQTFTPHFVKAGGGFTDTRLTSESVLVDPQTGFASIREGEGRSGVRIGWQFAAMYCNWLHNGAPTGSDVAVEVFTTGTYDMPAALTGPASFDLPISRSEDARYWIPTVDEWVKAAHYDPNRYGEGQEGYWLRMGGQVDPLNPGLPWEGGETSAGPEEAFGFTNQDAIPVAAYADITSPWGLFDTSGQESEWSETVGTRFGGIAVDKRYLLGSNSFGSLWYDTIDGAITDAPTGFSLAASVGFRIASVIPSPGAGTVVAFGALLAARRRR